MIFTECFFFRLESYGQESLKKYFDQEALCMPADQIKRGVILKDYSLFLSQPQFYKVVDTLEKYQEMNIDLDTQEGRDYYVFKRQLYQLYEIQHRSIEEHEAFSFQIERENLKWLYNANQDFNKEIIRANALEDLNHQANLSGLVFKRKAMDPVKLKGLGYFGLAGASYAYWPHVAQYLGQGGTTLAITAACLAGMSTVASQEPTINTITFVESGEHAGSVEINVQETLLKTKTIVANVSNVMALASLGNDDLGEDDLESNVVLVQNYHDVASGETVERGEFILPADSYRDVKALDWILAPKHAEDSTLDDFNDLVQSEFMVRRDMPKPTTKELLLLNSAYDRSGSHSGLDERIDLDDPTVEDNLKQMREFYGEERMAKMTPEEFYLNYKKFCSGLVF